jgi:Flp pilus assembly CpaF family ATPase
MTHNPAEDEPGFISEALRNSPEMAKILATEGMSPAKTRGSETTTPVPVPIPIPIPGNEALRAQPVPKSQSVFTEEENGYINAGHISVEEVMNGDPNKYKQYDELIVKTVKQIQDILMKEQIKIDEDRNDPTLKEKLIQRIDAEALGILSAGANLKGEVKAVVIGSIINELIGLGPLEPLWQDINITEVIANGPNSIYVERFGKLVKAKGVRFRSPEHLEEICNRIVAGLGRKFDTKSPMVDARLADGSRVNAVHTSLASGGPFLTIRRFPQATRSLVDLVGLGSMNEEMARNIAWLVANRATTLVVGSTGSGKSLDLETPIPTPYGFVAMGDLKVGDTVFDEKGQPTTVTGAYDVQYERPCYEMRFSDGSKIVADAEHLWKTETRPARVARGKQRNSQFTRKPPLSLDEISKVASLGASLPVGEKFSIGKIAQSLSWTTESDKSRLYNLAQRHSAGSKHQEGEGNSPYLTGTILLQGAEKWGSPWHDQREKSEIAEAKTTVEILKTLYASGGKHLNHSIPIMDGIAEMPIREDLLLSPRVLGLWLGDGASATARFSTADQELLEDFREAGFIVRHVAHYDYGISGGLQAALRAENVLNNKHIPEKYLWSSEAQRRALLSGLLDTDGGVATGGGIEFYSSNHRLASQVFTLIASLGYRPTLRTKTAKLHGRDMGLTYTVAFLGRGDEFRLERKQQSWAERAHRERQGDRHLQRFILDVVPVASRPVRCIRVANDSHLFLAGESFIPTHNTTLLNALSAAIPRDERIITIEDSLELRLNKSSHVAALEARPPDATGSNAVTIKDLVKNSLRMRPDRIIVGEVRGSEALDMLQACNTGHEGSMSTLHANGPDEAIMRLAVMIAQGGEMPSDKVDWLVGSALDLMIQVRRYKDGSRRISGIYEVPNIFDLTPGEAMKTIPLWEWKMTGKDENGMFLGEYKKREDISPALFERLGLEFEPLFSLEELKHICLS